jgi:hypothetical protein
LPKPSLKLPHSDLQVELVIRNRGIQVTAKGTITELAKDAESLLRLASLLGVGLTGTNTSVETEGAGASVEPGEAPVIKVTGSTKDNVQALFSTTWGRSPRSSSDVSTALSVNGVPESDAQIGVALLRLVKSGQLRRIQKDSKWHYYKIPQ